MNLRTKRANKMPVEGNRSPVYIGLAVLMDQQFFNATSDLSTGPKRPDPRIKIFPTRNQRELRARVVQHAEVKGIPIHEAEIKWRQIRLDATNHATAEIRKSLALSNFDDVIYLTITTRKHVIDALKAGEKFAAAEVHDIEHNQDSWNAGFQDEMTFARPVVIYIRHEGDGSYKIGKTMNPTSRDKAYRTHTTKSELIAEYAECGIVTEKNIHSYFSKQRTQNEFFRLSEDQAGVVTSRIRMRDELSKEGF